MRYVLICAGLLLISSLSRAVHCEGLFTADLAVPSKEDSVRDEALRRGIAMVMGRVVRTEDQSSATVKSIIAKPQEHFDQYEYSGSSGDGDLRIKIDFDESLIKRKLQQRGIKVWGPNRPETLVLLVLEENSSVRLLGPDSRIDLEPAIQDAAAATGLPIQLPLGDLEDQQSLAASDMVAGNAERLRRGALRYDTPVILTGLLRRTSPTDYESEWRVYLPDREERWKLPAQGFPQAIAGGFAGVYSRLATRLTPPNLEASDIEIRVQGVASVDDVNRVSADLAKLPPISKVDWLAVGNGEASFKVRAIGGKSFLERTLAFDRLLRPENATDKNFSGVVCRLQR